MCSSGRSRAARGPAAEHGVGPHRMKTLIAATLFSISLVAAADGPKNCNIGPANKTFGGAPWYVYACDDGRTVAIVSAPGSRAMPFLFVFTYKDGAYRLQGEGTGDKSVTAAAYDELKVFAPKDIGGLHSEASKAAKK